MAVSSKLKQIKSLSWNITKTEAIDFTKPFLWFDDGLYDDIQEVILIYD